MPASSPRKTVHGLLVAVLIATLVVPIVAIAYLTTAWDPPDGSLFGDVVALIRTRGNPVTLGDLAGHEVTRVCIASQYGAVRDMAPAAGVLPADLPDETIPWENFGLVMVGGDRVTYGSLQQTVFGGDWIAYQAAGSPLCFDGEQLAIVFKNTSPPWGGFLVDLAFTDPAPLIESR